MVKTEKTDSDHIREAVAWCIGVGFIEAIAALVAYKSSHVVAGDCFIVVAACTAVLGLYALRFREHGQEKQENGE